jgi:hypothetical protein
MKAHVGQRLGGPQSQSGPSVEEDSIFPLLRNEQLMFPAHSLATVPNVLSPFTNDSVTIKNPMYVGTRYHRETAVVYKFLHFIPRNIKLCLLHHDVH